MAVSGRVGTDLSLSPIPFALICQKSFCNYHKLITKQRISSSVSMCVSESAYAFVHTGLNYSPSPAVFTVLIQSAA